MLALEFSYQLLTGVAIGITEFSKELFIPPINESLVQLCPEVVREYCEVSCKK